MISHLLMYSNLFSIHSNSQACWPTQISVYGICPPGDTANVSGNTPRRVQSEGVLANALGVLPNTLGVSPESQMPYTLFCVGQRVWCISWKLKAKHTYSNIYFIQIHVHTADIKVLCVVDIDFEEPVYIRLVDVYLKKEDVMEKHLLE